MARTVVSSKIGRMHAFVEAVSDQEGNFKAENWSASAKALTGILYRPGKLEAALQVT